MPYFSSTNFFPFLLVSFFYIISTKLIPPEYNNGIHQDPNLDKSYLDKTGQNLYYLTKGNDKTMFNIVLNPRESLEVSFKTYTDSEILIHSLESGYKLYFGFDFMIENPNKTLKQFNTDIIICIFDKKDVNCYDYVYDIENYKYIRNDNGTISSNSLIPLGFNNLTLNILTKNVIGYKNYYCIKFDKKFNVPSQNTAIYNWVKYLPNDIIHKVTGFYGLIEDEEDLIEFSPKFPIYYQKLLFENGSGLKGNLNNNNFMEIFTFLKYALFLYITFMM